MHHRWSRRFSHSTSGLPEDVDCRKPSCMLLHMMTHVAHVYECAVYVIEKWVSEVRKFDCDEKKRGEIR